MNIQSQTTRPSTACRLRPSWSWSILGWLALTFVAGGATCARRQTLRDEFRPPVVFQQVPTLQQIAEQVNHSLAIQQLESNTLSITSPDISAKLSGSIRWERPYNFKLEAYPGARILGVALSAGSNEEMFWLQTQVPSPPTIYYARHDEFERESGPRRILPVSPLWLREALGVVEFDPNGQHEEPLLRSDGQLQVVSYIPSPRGAYKRVLVMDSTTGTISQSMLYNHLGKLVAIAQQEDHQYYGEIAWSLPHRVSIQLHPDDGPPMAFSIDVGFYMINEAADADATAFAPPDPTGISTVNLVQMNHQQNAVPTPPIYTRVENTPQQSLLSGYRTVR